MQCSLKMYKVVCLLMALGLHSIGRANSLEPTLPGDLTIYVAEDAVYRYVNATPSTHIGAVPVDWFEPEFDDSSWFVGQGAFGTSFGSDLGNATGAQTPNADRFPGSTAWSVNRDPYLRTTFVLAAPTDLTIWIAVDNGVESLYLNGINSNAFFNAEGSARRWEHVLDIPASLTRTGLNTIAMQIEDHGVATGFAMVLTSDDAADHTSFSTAADLVPVSLDSTALQSDCQSLEHSGLVEFTIRNQGETDVPPGFSVTVFEDRDRDGTFDVISDAELGVAVIAQGLAAGESITGAAVVSGTLSFRDAPVSVWVDSLGQVVESNVDNNVAMSGSQCEVQPVPGTLDPVVEWVWDSSDVASNWRNVMSVPSVVDLNQDGFPEIVFGSSDDNDGSGIPRGVLRVVDGRDGEEVFTVSNSAQRIAANCSVATGDIDGDGFPEIVALRNNGSQLLCFESDGELKWTSVALSGINSNGGPSIANLDQVGLPEIIIGRHVLDASGSLLWSGAADDGLSLSVVADVDLDGAMEVVAGATIYEADGTIQTEASGIPDGLVALGNFDGDEQAEVVLIAQDQMWIYQVDGSLLCGPIAIPGNGGGPPTVADYDGDGQAEIGVSGRSRYVVFESDCSVKWATPIQDFSSRTTGSSVFDFDGDGAAEVIYSDETRLWVFSGINGQERFSTPLSSCTWREYPLVADVDADGNAEIVAVANTNCGFGPQRGVYVFGSASDSWVATRQIWNQHAYHVTNVADDGSIPSSAVPNWNQPDLNNFRTQRLPSGQNPLVAPDLTASLLSLNAASCTNSLGMSLRVGNAGGLAVPAGINVAFCLERPKDKGPQRLNAGQRRQTKLEAPIVVAVGQTTGPIRPGEFEDLFIAAPGDFVGPFRLTAKVDDNGFGIGAVSECREDNNQCSDTFEVLASGLELVRLSPIDGTLLPAGSRVTLTGQAVTTGEELEIGGVVIQGEAAAGLDALGNFFHPVTVEEGVNVFHVSAFNRCGEATGTITVIGVPPGGDFEQLTEVTGRVSPSYSNTTWNPGALTLNVELSACNTGQEAMRLPLLARFEVFTVAGVELTNPDGWTEDGVPYVAFDVEDDPFLASEDCTARKLLVFSNPSQIPFSFQLSWLALQDGPPVFETVPVTEATVGEPYSYAARAVDPDGVSVTYGLGRGPVGMVVDAETGLVTWNPALSDLGTHSVEITATDGQGGRAAQSFIVEVLEERPNRPPFFTSAPPVQVSLAADYRYLATAMDPDGDALSFSKVSGPLELTVSSVGQVSWRTTLVGEYPVVIEVSDGRGGTATQAYVLSAGAVPVNAGSPILSGTPAAVVEQGTLYFFQPTSFDPDGDVLSFSSTLQPSGLQVDPTSGRITWIPDAGQVGLHDVQLLCVDGNGGSASMSWTIEVLPVSNRNPSITSAPTLSTEVNQPYVYSVVAADPDGDALTFELIDPPTGMVIGEQTGRVTWTPRDLGPALIVVRVTDPSGGAATQVFILTVLPPNEPPVITTQPVLTAAAGSSYFYDANATDANGDSLTWRLVHGPLGMAISATTGVVSWLPEQDQAGTFSIVIRVEDPYGGGAEQAYELQVVPDTSPPSVAILFSQEPAFLSQPMVVCVQAGDNVGVAGRTLSAEALSVPLDTDGCGTFTGTVDGSVVFVATATDFAGNTAMATRTLQVVDSNPENAPIVELQSPQPGSTIEVLTEVIASISDNNPETLTWTLDLVRDFDGFRRTLATGAGEVVSSSIGMIDPTLLLNGRYRVEVIADDGNFAVSQFSEVEVVGDLKLGNFQVSFTDLIVPSYGLPLSVQRRYDSLEANIDGDFGFGWSLAFPGRVSDTPNEARGEGLNVGDLVFLTLPNGTRPSFRTRYIASSFLFPFIGSLRFDPEPGVHSSLRAANGSDVVVSGAALFTDLFGGLYNPDLYEFEDPQLGKYTISESQGLLRIEDTNGVRIDVTPGGLIHSGGLSVVFDRDAQGRIVSVTEPDDPADGVEPGSITYAYDGIGNLIEVTNQAMAVTRLFYEQSEFPHYLTRVENPLGQQVVRLNYDDSGRLVSMTDADGSTIQLSCDPNAATETVFDGEGNPTVFQYDDQGRPLFIVDPLGEQQSFVYDPAGNLIEETDRYGRTTVYEYDGRGNRTVEIRPHPVGADPAEYTSRYVFDGNDRLTAIVLPQGGLITQEFDEFGNLEVLRDSNGRLLLEREYDEQGRVSLARNQFGEETRTTYDANGYPSSTLNDTEDLITSNYDMCGRLLSYDAGGPEPVVLQYDPTGKLRSIDFGEGSSSLMQTYDSAGRLDSMSSPTVGSYQRESSASGRISGWTRQDGVSLGYTYDPNGRVIEELDSLGNRTTYDYDPIGRRTETYDETLDARTTVEWRDSLNERAVTDAEGGVTIVELDPCCGEVEKITDARGNEWLFELTPSSRTRTDPLGRTTVDALSVSGLVLRRDLPGGVFETYEYESDNFIAESDTAPKSITDYAGNRRDYSHVRGELVTATTLCPEELYTYALEEELGARVAADPRGEFVRTLYDELGRTRRTERSGGAFTNLEYGPDSRLSRSENADGQVVTYAYDVVGRQIGKNPEEGMPISFGYRPNGTLQAVSDSTGLTGYSQTASGALRRIDYPNGGYVEYLIDRLERITRVSGAAHAGASVWTTSYGYDPNGNVESVTDPAGGTSLLEYDAANRLISRTLPNGIQTTYMHDDLDRVVSVEHRDSSDALLMSFTYDRVGGIGEPSRVTREDGSYCEYTYDQALRLTSESCYDAVGVLVASNQYSYDASGNRIEEIIELGTLEYSYEAGNRLSMIDGAGILESFEYDSSGRLSEISGNQRSATFSFNVFDQLEQATVRGTALTYSYDGFGRRTHAEGAVGTRDLAVAPGLVTGLEVTYSAANSTTNEDYVYAYVGDLPLMRLGPEGPRYYLMDDIGSVRALANPAGGLVAQWDYDAFGRSRASSGPEAGTPPSAGGDFRFQGGWLEEGTGLYHFRARDYDPITGRFLSIDGIPGNPLMPETFHPYVFAWSNPLLFADPSGQTLVSQATLKRFIALAIRDQAFDLGGTLATQLFATALQLFVPEILGFVPVLEGVGGLAAGRLFEGFMTGLLCGALGETDAADYLRFEVSMTTRGRPTDDGIGCRSGSGPGFTPAGGARPDYVISQHPPTELRTASGRPKSFLIGDFKLSIDAMYRDWVGRCRGGNLGSGKKPAQFNAIANHARNYSFAPIVVNFALRRQRRNLTVDKDACILQKFLTKNVFAPIVGGF